MGRRKPQTPKKGKGMDSAKSSGQAPAASDAAETVKLPEPPVVPQSYWSLKEESSPTSPLESTKNLYHRQPVLLTAADPAASTHAGKLSDPTQSSSTAAESERNSMESLPSTEIPSRDSQASSVPDGEQTPPLGDDIGMRRWSNNSDASIIANLPELKFLGDGSASSIQDQDLNHPQQNKPPTTSQASPPPPPSEVGGVCDDVNGGKSGGRLLAGGLEKAQPFASVCSDVASAHSIEIGGTVLTQKQNHSGSPSFSAFESQPIPPLDSQAGECVSPNLLPEEILGVVNLATGEKGRQENVETPLFSDCVGEEDLPLDYVAGRGSANVEAEEDLVQEEKERLLLLRDKPPSSFVDAVDVVIEEREGGVELKNGAAPAVCTPLAQGEDGEPVPLFPHTQHHVVGGETPSSEEPPKGLATNVLGHTREAGDALGDEGVLASTEGVVLGGHDLVSAKLYDDSASDLPKIYTAKRDSNVLNEGVGEGLGGGLMIGGELAEGGDTASATTTIVKPGLTPPTAAGNNGMACVSEGLKESLDCGIAPYAKASTVTMEKPPSRNGDFGAGDEKSEKFGGVEANDVCVGGEEGIEGEGAKSIPEAAWPSCGVTSEVKSLEAIEKTASEVVESAENVASGKMGATIVDRATGCAVFRLWGTHINECWVEIEGKEYTMLSEKANPCIYSAKVSGMFPGSTYRFLLTSNWNDCFHSEGEKLVRYDPYARSADLNEKECRLVDLQSFQWEPFTPPLFNKLIIYELHLKSFPKSDAIQRHGSYFKAIVEHLDYIRGMGFNAIELMPVQRHGGLWGYSARLLMALHDVLGTPEEFQAMVNQCHQKGLAVIVDVVANHGSTVGNDLWNWDGYGPRNEGGIYFEGGGDTMWGRKFAFHKPEMQQMIKSTLMMFLEEYNVDGIRLDSVHNMPFDLLQRLTYDIRAQFPKKFLIAEITPENPRICSHGGFDSCWIHSNYYDAMKIMRNVEREHHMDMLKAIIEVHSGFKASYQCISSILGSHDQIGNRKKGSNDGMHHMYMNELLGGRSNWHSRAQCRMWYTLQACSRALPMLFMGTENHQSGYWDAEAKQPFVWDYVDDDNDVIAKEMRLLVRDSNTLRLQYDELTNDSDVPISFTHMDYHNRVIGFRRGRLLIVVNLGEAQWEKGEYGVNSGVCEKQFAHIFNSQSAAFGGWNESWSSGALHTDASACLKINLPKWSTLVFRQQN